MAPTTVPTTITMTPAERAAYDATASGRADWIDAVAALQARAVVALGPDAAHATEDVLVLDPTTGDAVVTFRAAALRKAAVAKDPTWPFVAYADTCYRCERPWGACTCREPYPGHSAGEPPPEDFDGVDVGWMTIADPSSSECTRFLVEPEVYYALPFVAWRERQRALGRHP